MRCVAGLMCKMQKVIVQLVLGFVCVCDFEKML